ncbi:MAG: hypothetical protein [Microviridae sp.]|nr:MAG: hypothetical protein [Microviridae sp.]
MFGIDDFIIGSVAGGVIDAFSGHNANQANVAQANANREFSRNAHQIEVADLLKAGLSPMLSYRGQGASLGGGTIANVQPLTRDSAEKMTSAMSASNQAKLMQSGITKNDADANLADASAAKARTEEMLLRRGLTGGKVEAEVQELGSRAGAQTASADEARQRIQNLKAEIPRIKADIERIGEESRRLNAEGAKIRTQDIQLQVETDIRQLDYKEKAAVVEDLISMIKHERAKMDMSMPGAQNRRDAQESGFRRMLSKMGFAPSETTDILDKAGAALLLRK